ncbi:MAG: hypothetical protein K2Y27_04825 [Xanthobacteraceae bacterium]|nr:hypothetical protein [Xanthobacteraceae bacterium]
MKKTIVATTAAAFFATSMLAAAPAFAAGKAKQPEMVPLPAITLLPTMLILNAKKKENFKPVKPYGKKTRTSL